MTPQQVFGNWLATFLMRLFFAAKYTDLGPFRAIKYEKLLALNMEDKTYGWTVEMQLKALKQKLSYMEVPVKYRNRIGVSKVSGTVKGTIFAGIKILGWIFKYSLKMIIQILVIIIYSVALILIFCILWHNSIYYLIT